MHVNWNIIERVGMVTGGTTPYLVVVCTFQGEHWSVFTPFDAVERPELGVSKTGNANAYERITVKNDCLEQRVNGSRATQLAGFFESYAMCNGLLA